MIQLMHGKTVVDSQLIPTGAYPDLALIEALDILIRRSNVDRFTLKGALALRGVDKNSSLYKIIRALNAALAAGRTDHIGGR